MMRPATTSACGCPGHSRAGAEAGRADRSDTITAAGACATSDVSDESGCVVRFLPDATFEAQHSKAKNLSSPITVQELLYQRAPHTCLQPRHRSATKLVPVPTPPAATPQQTINALADKARWAAVPYRRTFVQRGALNAPEPGPLAEFVLRHDSASFDIFNLSRLVASAEPYDVEISPKVFGRALGIAAPTVSNAVKRLSDRKLVRRLPGRRLFVRVLREDGSGEAYSPPWQRSEAYFQVPIEYWIAPEEWHRCLTLPEKAMLFIALSLVDNFTLPYDRVPDWYGLSPSTAERGLLGLQRRHLLKARKQFKPAPLAPRGYTELLTYTLAKPFGPNLRRNKPKAEEAPLAREEVVA